MGNLTVKKIDSLREAGVYRDGDGLELRVKDSGAKSWVIIVRYNGKRPELGAGSYPEVTLADARAKLQSALQYKRAGKDPRAALQVSPSASRAVTSSMPTFAECAEAFIRMKSAEWSGPKQAPQWTSSLRTYAEPFIGHLPADQIGVDEVEAVLRPYWETKTETMSRVRARIEKILNWAIAKGYRSSPNPAVWDGNLEFIFPAKNKVAPVKHHNAMPYKDIPEFMAALRASNALGARALEFCILTTTRNTECAKARWAEIEGEVWTIPAERMKAGKEHRVPLTPRMLEILKALPYTGDFVFAGRKGGLSNNTLRKYLQEDMQRPDATPHGFRSTFKDWAVEESDFAGDLSEAQLAHKIANASQAAYERGDKLRKRRELMLAWEAYCGGA